MKYILPILLLGASFAYAQDYSSAAGAGGSTNSDGGLDAVIAAQDTPIAVADVNVTSSSKALKDYLEDKLNIKTTGYSSAKNRIVQIGSAGFNATREELVSEEFIDQRSMLVVEAQLNAKAKIIEAILSKMSASQILDVPGNPIDKQIAAEKAKYNKVLGEANVKVAEMKAFLNQNKASLDQAIIDEVNGITMGDRFAAFADGIIKKVDETYQKEDITADKLERIEELKERLTIAVKMHQQAELERNKMLEKAKAIHGDIKKSVTSKASKLAEMPIFGAVTLATTESYDNKKYEVSVAVAWSPKLEMSSRAIMMGKKVEAAPRPTKLSFDEWVNAIDLSTTFGTRQYLANDGKRYFVGIVATGYDPDDYDTLDEARDFSDMFAEQECVLSLFSEMRSQKEVETRRAQYVNADDETAEKLFKSSSKNIRAEIEGISISGLSVVRSEEEIIHPISGQTMYVAVAAIDSDLAAASEQFMTEAYATLKELNVDQSYKDGLYSGMKDEAAASKNDRKAKAEGYNAGRSGVSKEYNARKEAEKPKQSASVYIAPEKSAPRNVNVRQVNAGTYVGGVDVDDDF